MASKLPLILLLTALACLSQLFRASNSVIAPEPMRDFDLDARQFGWAGSAFFLALFAMQLPVGCWPPSDRAQCRGLTVLPAVTGYIVEALGATDLAYRTVFATLAGGLLLGLIPYSRSPANASR